jgi:ABC-type sugar transport system, periplasmic component
MAGWFPSSRPGISCRWISRPCPRSPICRPTALIAGSYNGDGKLYSLPFASQTLGLFINKDVFAKAGLTPPTTWDEFITVSKALKDKGIIPLANGLGTSWFNEMFVAIFTNPFLGPDFVKDLTTGKTTFKDPRYVAALGKLLELRDYMPPGYEGVDYDTAGQLFLTGRAAMLAGGSFDIATYRAANPQINMDFIAPPAAEGRRSPLCDQVLRRRLCRERRLAEQGSRLEAGRLHGHQGLRRQAGGLLGNISPIKGVEIKDPMLSQVAALNQSAMPHINVVYFRFQKPTGSELLQGDITKMMAGSMTPEQLATDLTNGIAKWYVPFQGK